MPVGFAVLSSVPLVLEPSACRTPVGDDTMLGQPSYRVKSPNVMSPYMLQVCLQNIKVLHRAKCSRKGATSDVIAALPYTWHVQMPH